MNNEEIFNKIYESPPEQVPWNQVDFAWLKKIINEKQISGQTALDLGCGIGTQSIYLAENSDFEKIIGVDISENTIQIAKQNNNAKCEFIAHDACDLSFLGDQKFDFILDWANIHGIAEEKREQYIEQINKHSEVGSFLILRAFKRKYHKSNFLIDKFGMKIYVFTKEELIGMFPEFRILKENETEILFGPNNKQKAFFIELLMVKK